MTTRQINVERFCIESKRAFDDVLASMEKWIGRPNMKTLQPKLDAAASFPEYQRLVQEAVGAADLMEFLRLDLGAAIAKDPQAKALRIVRIIAGNPLIMKQMVTRIPHAGSYAPVTIIAFEKDEAVHLCYDKMESLLASYNDEAALSVARDLDSKVIRLLTDVAG